MRSSDATDADVVLAEEVRSEWLRLVAELRALVHASVQLDAPPGRMRELADRVAELSREVRRHAGGRPIPLYRAPQDLPPDALHAMLPFSPVMGRYNPLAPPLDLQLAGDGGERPTVVGRVTFDRAFQGAEGLVHGGMLSAVFDEVLAMAAIVAGLAGPTARLTVHYRRPTPTERELVFESRVDRIHRRKVHVRASCHCDGELVAEGEGLFIRLGAVTGWGPRREP